MSGWRSRIEHGREEQGGEEYNTADNLDQMPLSWMTTDYPEEERRYWSFFTLNKMKFEIVKKIILFNYK